jgi:hypothetical protein
MKWKNRPAAQPDTRPPQRDGPYDLITALADELAHIGKLRKRSDSEFVQRLFVRQFGSSIDAYAFYFQDRARESANSEGVVLSEEEKQLLHVGPEYADEDRLRPAYQRITKNILFGITVFAKIRGVEPPCIDLPSQVDAAIRIRNRITHPKRASDLQISAGELKTVAVAIQWLQSIASWGSREEVNYIERVRQRIHESIERQKQDFASRLTDR